MDNYNRTKYELKEKKNNLIEKLEHSNGSNCKLNSGNGFGNNQVPTPGHLNEYFINSTTNFGKHCQACVHDGEDVYNNYKNRPRTALNLLILKIKLNSLFDLYDNCKYINIKWTGKLIDTTNIRNKLNQFKKNPNLVINRSLRFGG